MGALLPTLLLAPAQATKFLALRLLLLGAACGIHAPVSEPHKSVLESLAAKGRLRALSQTRGRDFTSNDYRDSSYQLFDAQGKLIKKDKISQSKSELNFSDLPSAMYIIKIKQEGRDIKIFKIIKK